MFRFGRQAPRDFADTPTSSAGDAGERECRVLLERWRRSEQRVWHSWKAWLAADARDSSTCYRVLLLALAEEEKAAAAFELLVRMVAANPAARA